MRNKIIIIGIYLFAALLYITVPYGWFKVCEVKDTPMKCHWSTTAEIGVAIILIGIVIAYALTKTEREEGLLSFVAIVNSMVAILIPKVLIGGCSMVTMPCQSRTFPAFYVISILLILVSVINILSIIGGSRSA